MEITTLAHTVCWSESVQMVAHKLGIQVAFNRIIAASYVLVLPHGSDRVQVQVRELTHAALSQLLPQVTGRLLERLLENLLEVRSELLVEVRRLLESVLEALHAVVHDVLLFLFILSDADLVVLWRRYLLILPLLVEEGEGVREVALEPHSELEVSAFVLDAQVFRAQVREVEMLLLLVPDNVVHAEDHVGLAAEAEGEILAIRGAG